MGHFVIARRDHGIGIGEGRDVPGHAHAQALRFPDHAGHPCGIEAVVDLHLPIAARAVPAHRVQRFRLAARDEAVTRAVGAASFQEAVAHDARPGHFARIDAVRQVDQEGVLVAHVAHAGHARGDVEQGGLQRDVGMHVVQAGNDHAARTLDGRLAG